MKINKYPKQIERKEEAAIQKSNEKKNRKAISRTLNFSMCESKWIVNGGGRVSSLFRTFLPRFHRRARNIKRTKNYYIIAQIWTMVGLLHE